MNLLEKLKKKNNKKERRIYYSIPNEYYLKKDIEKIYSSNIDNNEYINLYDILSEIKKVTDALFSDKELIEDNIDNKIINNFGKNSYIVIYKINNNTIELGFTPNYKMKNPKKIIINIENNIYKIKNDNTNKGEIILNLIKQDLDNLLKLNNTFNYFHNQYKEYIRCINSSLMVDISLYSINLYTKCDKDLLNIKYSTYEDKFYKSGNKEMIELINGKEFELLHKIYISIKDCPEYYKNIITNKNRKKYKYKRYSK